MTPEQIQQQYGKTPNEEFCAAIYDMKFPERMSKDGKAHNVTMSVYASGEMRDWGKQKYPAAKLHVTLEDGEFKKSCLWPFECDCVCKALLDDIKVIALLNYIRYI